MDALANTRLGGLRPEDVRFPSDIVPLRIPVEPFKPEHAVDARHEIWKRAIAKAGNAAYCG
jgi:hypothetical protein